MQARRPILRPSGDANRQYTQWLGSICTHTFRLGESTRLYHVQFTLLPAAHGVLGTWDAVRLCIQVGSDGVLLQIPYFSLLCPLLPNCPARHLPHSDVKCESRHTAT